MTIYNVSYDLYQGNKAHNYNDLYEAIKASPGWAKLVESTWLVSTSETAVELRDRLSHHMDPQDRIVVMVANKPAAWRGMPDKVSEWIQKME